MQYKGTRVLLLDGHGRQTAIMLEWLHGLGCHITTMSFSKLDIGYSSRYPHVRLIEPDARNNAKYYGEVIDREIQSGKYEVVIPILEVSTDFVLRNTKKYLPLIKIAAANYDAFSIAYNKQKTMMLCMENNIPCPITRKDEQPLESFCQEISFPLAIKPRQGSGGIGFRRVDNLNDLQSLIEEGIVDLEHYVIQEFIPRTDKQYRLFIFADAESIIKTHIITRSARQYPLNNGPGCLAITENNTDIAEIGRKLINVTRWIGYIHISFMIDPRDDTPKLFEINGRINAGVKMCKLCGYNIAEQMLDLAYGKEIKAYPPNDREGIILRYSQSDIMWFIKSSDRFRSNPSWFTLRNTHDYIFSIKDPIPYFTYTLDRLLRYREEMRKRNS